MDWSMPGLPVHQQLPEFTQIHLHWVVMPSNHLILCLPLLLLPSLFPGIRVFSNESALRIEWPKYWSFSISPSNEHSGLISFTLDWFDLLAVQGTLKSLLPVPNPKESQPWILIGKTDTEAPIIWPPGMKNWPTKKGPDIGKDWGQEEKGVAEDEMVGWHHQLNGHDFKQILGDSEGQGNQVCCSPWSRKEVDRTEWTTRVFIESLRERIRGFA